METELPIYLISAVAVSFILVAGLAGIFVRIGFPLPSDTKRLSHIDGLRGYLSLAVVAHHFYIWSIVICEGASWHPPKVNFLNQLGSGSVGLFFMITGFVFYPRILDGFRINNWPAVYTARVFRIVPMTFVSFLLVSLVVMMRANPNFTSKYILSMVTWVSTWRESEIFDYPDSGRINAYVLWSLRYEWFFYLAILPGAALLVDQARKVRLEAFVVPLVLFLITVVLRVFSWLFHWNLGWLCYFPLFFVGMISYEIQDRVRSDSINRSKLASTFALLALLVAFNISQFPYGISLPFLSVFFILFACGSDIFGLTNTRASAVLGECSFSIYLLHGIMLDLFFVTFGDLIASLRPPYVAIMIIPVYLTVLVVAIVCHLLVERPMIRIGRSVSNRLFPGKSRLSRLQVEIAP